MFTRVIGFLGEYTGLQEVSLMIILLGVLIAVLLMARKD